MLEEREVLASMAQPLLVNGPYINELSQGPSGAEEFVEIIVYGDVNCNDTKWCFGFTRMDFR